MALKFLGRFALGETIRITYEARRLTTGLADVKLTVWNEALSKVVDEGVCSELGNGIYYYDYLPLTEGNFLFFVDSASQPSRLTGGFRVPITITAYSDRAVVANIEQNGFSDRTVVVNVERTGFSDRAIVANIEQTGFSDREVVVEVERIGFSDRTVSAYIEKTGFSDRTVTARIRQNAFSDRTVAAILKGLDYSSRQVKVDVRPKDTQQKKPWGHQTNLEEKREPYNVNDVKPKRNVERRAQYERWDEWIGRSMVA